LFLNGKLIATAVRGSYDSTNLWIGAYKNSANSILDYQVALSNFAIRDECVWSGSGYSLDDQVFTPPTAPYGTATSNRPLIQSGFNTPLINSGLLMKGA
jgi:hypothetical protein